MGKLRVLMYHRVDEEVRDFLTVSKAQLAQQMTYLKEHYTVIRLSEVIKHIETGAPLPERSALVTFDDGYENNYTLAYPVFRELNLPFAVFPVADFIGKTVMYDGIEQSFMSVEELKRISDLAEFGYHGFRHDNLMAVQETEWEQEIRSCVERFTSLGIPVRGAWAYTYGSFPKRDNSKLKEFARLCGQFGISCAFRIGNRVNHIPLKQSFAIERIDIRGGMTFAGFKRRLRLGKIF